MAGCPTHTLRCRVRCRRCSPDDGQPRRDRTGAVLHLINHALFKGLLFLCDRAVLHAAGVTKLSELGGIIQHRPLLAIAFSVVRCRSRAYPVSTTTSRSTWCTPG